MGALAYVGQAYRFESMMAAYSPQEIAFLDSTPAWSTAAFAIAVFAGVLGCLFMLMKKKWAVGLLMLSLLAVLVRMIWYFFMSDGVEVHGAAAGYGMSLTVIVIAIILYMFSKKSAAKGWLS